MVDDNAVNLQVGKGLMKIFGLECDTARSGFEALEMLREREYDLVFMDHMMPEMDGIEATAAIRALGRWNETVPIIALTANAIVGSRELFLANQLDDYLSKPIEIQPLNEMILRWLPEQKIVTTPKEEQQKEQQESLPLSDQLRELELECGLNIRPAVDRIGVSDEAYIGILKTYAGNLKGKIDLLSQLVSRGDWNAFRIEIHAQKSALLNVGADRLSERARKLELASDSKHSYIIQSFPDFIKDLTDLQQRLMAAFPNDDEARMKERPAATADQQHELKQIIENTLELINALENDTALTLIEQLKQVSYGAATDQLIAEAGSSIDGFDYDRAAELLQQILV